MTHALKWLGHICRMPIDRLPKLALFGTWIHNTRSPTKAHTQTYWISEVLRTADIHQLDFFRLAQNRDPTKWDALIKQAFPHRTLTTAAKRALNNWRPGHPLPDNTQVRRRRTRTVWTSTASSIPPNTCPVCRQGFDRLRDLHIHYLHTHAITDPAVTTFNVFQCGECRQTFPNAYARLNHECRILYAVRDHDIRDKYGWLPLQIPNIEPPPPIWKIYTDGSFQPQQPATAGWGFAVYNAEDVQDTSCLFEIYGPVVLDAEDQRFLGAQQSSNNTGELTAIAEAITWLRDEAPGPDNTPAEILYDSHYAANLVLGHTTPHANHTLANNAHSLYKEVSQTRVITFRWVKGHSQVPGNDKADELANLGRQNRLGTHSRRWAAPRQGDLTVATAETCRKCGRVFISARKCARHEMQCTEQMPEGGDDHPCRICGQSFPDRVTRNTHQLKCNGTADLNLQCKYCRESFETIETRIRHEGSCTQKQAHLSQDQSAWTCPRCQWKLPNTVQGPSKRTSAQERHNRQCRGSDVANRTCNKCHTVWDSMVARIAHELYCKTDEEKRTCRYCQQIFDTINQRHHHEKRHRREGNI